MGRVLVTFSLKVYATLLPTLYIRVALAVNVSHFSNQFKLFPNAISNRREYAALVRVGRVPVTFSLKVTPLSTVEDIDLRELSRIIYEGTQKLPPRMRAVFDLSRKELLINKEIAVRLGS